jgi:acyl carrier protein
MADQDRISAHVRELLSQMLGLPGEGIGPGTSQETTPSWTSLNHLMLVSQIESEFGLMFSADELRDLTSFDRIIEVLVRRLSDSE